jgi:hypothetical protein
MWASYDAIGVFNAWNPCIEGMNPWKNRFNTILIVKSLQGKFVMEFTKHLVDILNFKNA